MTLINASVENGLIDCLGYDRTKYLELHLGKHRQNQRFIIRPYISEWIFYQHGFKEAFFFSDLKVQKWSNFYPLEMDKMNTRISLFLKKSTHENGPAIHV